MFCRDKSGGGASAALIRSGDRGGRLRSFGRMTKALRASKNGQSHLRVIVRIPFPRDGRIYIIHQHIMFLLNPLAASMLVRKRRVRTLGPISEHARPRGFPQSKLREIELVRRAVNCTDRANYTGPIPAG